MKNIKMNHFVIHFLKIIRLIQFFFLGRNKFVDQTKSFHQRFQNLADTFNKNLQQIQENPFEEERILIDKLSMYQEKILIDQALKNQTNKIENK